MSDVQLDPELLIRVLDKGISPALIVLAFVRGWIVSGAHYREQRQENQRLQAIIERSMELSGRAVTAGERLADRSKS